MKDINIYKTKKQYNYIPNNWNNFRHMTDEQLKQIFESTDIPTNEDHIAIIDSKINKFDVYNRTEMEELLEAYFHHNPDEASKWIQQENERRENELERNANENYRKISYNSLETAANEKIIEVEDKIYKTNEKIEDIDNTKNDLVSTIENNLSEFENRFSELEGLNTSGEIIQARTSIDGTVHESLKNRLSYDYSNKSDEGHRHNEIYYTQNEIDVKFDDIVANSGSRNVAYGAVSLVENWICEDEEYYIDIIHNLQTKRVLVVLFDSDTNDSVKSVIKTLDDNTVRIFTDEPINATISVINGNAQLELIYAIIDDTQISTTRTWSSDSLKRYIDEKYNFLLSNSATKEEFNILASEVRNNKLEIIETLNEELDLM